MDSTFLTGTAAFISAVLIFCGSVFLLLSFVLGARLAYWVTASVTLAFVLIMGGVWSYGTVPLGPVGETPTWNEVDLGQDAAQLDFGPAAEYPDGDWFVADTEDTTQATQASELGSATADYLEAEIAKGGEAAESFATLDEALLDEESVRLLDQDGDIYGAVTYKQVEVDPEDEEAVQPEGSGDPIVVVMSYDPGNQFGPARMITAGAFLLLVAHLFGLSRAEKRAKRDREKAENA